MLLLTFSLKLICWPAPPHNPLYHLITFRYSIPLISIFFFLIFLFFYLYLFSCASSLGKPSFVSFSLYLSALTLDTASSIQQMKVNMKRSGNVLSTGSLTIAKEHMFHIYYIWGRVCICWSEQRKKTNITLRTR